MYETEIAIKQGVPKGSKPLKLSILKNMQIDWLKTQIFDLDLSDNHQYHNSELNAYFYQLFAENCSGNLAVSLAMDNYDFSLMDQQTASERFDELSMKEIAKMLNTSILEQAKKLPTYQSDYKLANVKSRETARRRELAQKSSNEVRPRQREKGIDPPEGRYLGLDFTLKPSYMDIDVIREEKGDMAMVLTKDRRKNSTTTFTGHHTVYDYEHGSRQILATSMLCNKEITDYKAGYKREGLAEVVSFLIDPIIDEISVTGLVGDGDYFNKGIMRYCHKHELDYVLRKDISDSIRLIIEEQELEDKLKDGCGIIVEEAQTMGRGKNQVTYQLIIVRRDKELVPLAIPTYSDLTAEQALLLFEERFGIETAYRETYKYLPTTTSKTPQYRLVLYGMTCWFYNLLLNYYQIVVIFSSNRKNWDISLRYIKKKADQLFADLLKKKA